MTLGFVLPLALTMIAIPLEYLLQSGRTVLGGVVEVCLSTLVIALRILANALKQLGKLTINIYDFLIAVPLRGEAALRQKRPKKIGASATESRHDDYYPPLPAYPEGDSK
ncbi:MAG: hypothetical protein ACI9Y1_000881 [Lentisphaeria bacterium]|jgi:hypothetical protein